VNKTDGKLQKLIDTMNTLTLTRTNILITNVN